MKDVMVDIETTGTNPNRAAMIQLAGVKFDHKTGEVDSDFFNQCLLIPAYRTWEEGTREFWMKQPEHVIESIFNRMRDPRTVLEEFLRWVPDGAVLWAKPTHFEFPFISSYYTDYELPQPFHYRYVVNVRSFLEGLAFPNEPMSDKDIEMKGDAHDALTDTLHQVKWVLTAIDQHTSR